MTNREIYVLRYSDGAQTDTLGAFTSREVAQIAAMGNYGCDQVSWDGDTADVGEGCRFEIETTKLYE